MRKCFDCGAPKSRKGVYCKPCGYKHRIRPTGLIYKLVKENPTTFKKGLIPWNRGTKSLVESNSGSFVKGFHYSSTTEFKEGSNKEENNFNWKGDDVGYFALHTWVKRNLGSPGSCKFCGGNKNLQWANKSWKYKRDISDWISLCRKCHVGYDKNNWGLATRRFKL